MSDAKKARIDAMRKAAAAQPRMTGAELDAEMADNEARAVALGIEMPELLDEADSDKERARKTAKNARIAAKNALG